MVLPLKMSSNRDQPSRPKPRSSRMESTTTEARLDTLIPPRPVGSRLPSRLDQSTRDLLPSKLDSTRRDPQTFRPEPRLEDRFASLLEKPNRKPKPYRPEPSLQELASRMEKSHRDQKSPWTNDTSRKTVGSNTDNLTGKSYHDILSKQKQHIPSAKKPSMFSHLDASRPHQTDNLAAKTAFTNPHDIQMATRQLQYDTLPVQEQKKQEEWAQKKIQEFGKCVAGFKWQRVPGGYNCSAGNHWMTDAELAEGQGAWRYKFGSSWDGLYRERRIGFSQGLHKFSEPIYPGDPVLQPWLKAPPAFTKWS